MSVLLTWCALDFKLKFSTLMLTTVIFPTVSRSNGSFVSGETPAGDHAKIYRDSTACQVICGLRPAFGSVYPETLITFALKSESAAYANPEPNCRQ